MEPLDRAHDIRKFEIGLYWKRTTYFWTLIAAAFAGFFVIQSANFQGDLIKQTFSFVVANLGFLLSIGWFFINRGSKFWQQSWEIHVDRLEMCSNERLVRFPAYRPEQRCWLIDPAPYSVSKINQITSFYVALVWFGLGLWTFVQWHGQAVISDTPGYVRGLLIVFGLFTLVFCWLFHCKGRTRLEDKGLPYDYCLPERTPNPVPVPPPAKRKSC